MGKTSLMQAYTLHTFRDWPRPTVAEDYKCTLRLGRHDVVSLRVQDSRGQEDIANIMKHLLSNDPTIALCFACNDREAFKSITSFWLPEILSIIEQPRIILCATKSDIFEPNNKDFVSLAETKDLGKRIQAYRAYFCSSKEYCSSYDNDVALKGNVEKIFRSAIRVHLKKEGYFRSNWVSKTCCHIL